MSEVTFKKHLNDLKQVLGLIKGDIEKGPEGKINDWYNQTLQVIYDYEDMIESIINARNDYDEDSLEDGEIVEDSSNMFFQEENDSEVDINSEDLQAEDEEEFDSEDIEIKDDESNTADAAQTYEIVDNNHKTITIKVILE